MSNRIAFFSDGSDIVEYFGFEDSRDAIFESHYNIAEGHHIPVITWSDEKFDITRQRWGKDFEKNAEPAEVLSGVEIKDQENSAVARAIIPISGFYIWKRDKKNDRPFFVRKIDNAPLYVAGFTYKDEKNNFIFTEMLMMKSNTLIQPITDEMPLILKRDHAKQWLKGELDADVIHKKATLEFLITELTVHRVSKDLNDLSKNDASLIQPIPK